MSQETGLVVRGQESAGPVVGYTPEQMGLIRSQIAKGCSDGEIALFCHVARIRGLDPFAKQIYAIQRGGQMTIMVGIDGLRVLASRGGKYRGSGDTQWCGPDGAWVDVWLQKTPPAAARVAVMHADYDRPIVEVATMAEYGQQGGLWRSHPSVMLAKCAEARALRRAFPAECSGLYESSEIPRDEPARAQAPAVTRITTHRQVGSTSTQAIVQAFGALGVPVEEVELYLGCLVHHITDSDLEALRIAYRRITAGREAWADLMAERYETQEREAIAAEDVVDASE
jgi:phage recombination protein Bet